MVAFKVHQDGSETTGPDQFATPSHPRESNGLVDLISEVVAAVDWPGKGSLYLSPGKDRFSSELLMRAATFFTVADIEVGPVSQCSREDELNLAELCDGNPPDWLTLREFRDSHGPIVRQCAARVYQKAVQIRFGVAEDALVADDCIARALDNWFERLSARCARETARFGCDTQRRMTFRD